MVVSPFVCESPMLLNLFCFLLFFFKLYFCESVLRWTIKLLLLLLLLHYGERLIQVFVFCLPRTILPQHYLCFIQISLNLNSILYYKNIFVVGSSSQSGRQAIICSTSASNNNNKMKQLVRLYVCRYVVERARDTAPGNQNEGVKMSLPRDACFVSERASGLKFVVFFVCNLFKCKSLF